MKSIKSYKHKHRLKGNKSKVISPIDAFTLIFPEIKFDPTFIENMRKYCNAVVRMFTKNLNK